MNPCIICGRDERLWCSESDNGLIFCMNGDTFNAEKIHGFLKIGDVTSNGYALVGQSPTCNTFKLDQPPKHKPRRTTKKGGQSVLKDKAVIQSIDEDSKAFDELVDCAVYLIETKIPIIQRAGIIRNQAKMLSMPLSSKDVFSIMAKARRDIQGIDKGEEPNVELDVPEECWLWEDLIAEGTLNLVVSMPKVGKSSLIGAFLGQLSSEFTEFLGKEIIGKKRSIYICGTDQPINDWIKILIPSGLAERTESGKVILKEPLKRLWHKGKPIHLTEEEIELLYDVAVDDPN